MTKKQLFYTILLFVYLIFHDLIKLWYDKMIVGGLLSHIKQSGGLYYSVFILSVLTIIYFGWLIRKSYPLNMDWVGFTAILSLTYVLYRFNSNEYVFLQTLYFPSVKYSDYLLLFAFGIVILGIWNRVQKNKAPLYLESPFLLDAPISEAKYDKLNRGRFARNLAMKIQSKPKDLDVGALAIGINGKWGSGKTSFMNMIEENIYKNNRVIIKFNPWLSKGPEKIIEDFFEILSAKLRLLDSSISKQVHEYARTLTDINENILTKGINSVFEFISGSESRSEYYVRINECLEKVNKQIIIFVDDLDRLDDKEVIEVLRIIRNTANFNNLVFIVSYDRDYVIEALRNFNSKGASTFLEKVFQIEYEIPQFKYSVLINILKEQLSSSLQGKVSVSDIENAVNYTNENGRAFATKRISTPRDVIRLANSLESDLLLVSDSVNFIDFYLIQILKLKYYNVYKLLSDNRTAFFRKAGKRVVLSKKSDLDFGRWTLFGMDLEEEKKEEDEVSFFEVQLLKNENLIELDRLFLISTVDILLEPKLLRQNKKAALKLSDLDEETESIDPNSFGFWGNFENYFTLHLLETDFPSNEFHRARLGEYDDFKEKVDSWINAGFKLEVEERLEEIRDFESVQEWSNHFKILMYFNKLEDKLFSQLKIEYKRLLDILSFPSTNNLFNDLSEYRQYVFDLLIVAEDPYILETEILFTSLRNNIDIGLQKVEIQKILVGYLKRYLEEHDELNPIGLKLYELCVPSPYEDSDGTPYIKQINKLYREYVKKNLGSKNFHLFISFKRHDFMETLYGLNHKHVEFFFRDNVSLEKYVQNYLASQQDDSYKEFSDFLSQVSNGEFIRFKFKHVCPILII